MQWENVNQSEFNEFNGILKQPMKLQGIKLANQNSRQFSHESEKTPGLRECDKQGELRRPICAWIMSMPFQNPKNQ
jgi:hypothetical protein